MWPEIQACIDNTKHELKLTNKALENRLEESNGSVPDAFCSPLFTFVELSGCAKLVALPQNIEMMTNLHELLIQNCGLTSLPDGIGTLPLLRTLILEGNQLQQLPEGIFSLPRLHTLNASRNQLTVIPEEVINAKELHVLNLSFNKLEALPKSLTKLPKLSTLIASHNAISHFPSGISKLSLLSDLQLAHCSLTAVPQELAAVPKLKTLVLDPNPFDDKKLPKVLKEGRLKNIITHIKKHGAPPSKEEEDAAAAAVAKLQLAAAAARPYKLLPVNKEAQLDVHVHAEIKGVRPHLVCAVLRGVNFAQLPGLYEKFIALQTAIHESPMCNKREAAAIGTHDLAMLQLPLHYEALAPSDISFVPLSRDKDAAAAADEAEGGAAAAAAAAAARSAFKPGQEITAEQLPQYFAGDKSMLRYLSYIQDKPKKAAPLYAVLRDSSQAVLSVSPVINAEPCRITEDSQDVLVEVSSSDSLEVAQKVAQEFITQFAHAWSAAAGGGGGGGGGLGAEGQQQQQQQLLEVAPVRLLTHGTGHVRSIFPR